MGVFPRTWSLAVLESGYLLAESIKLFNQLGFGFPLILRPALRLAVLRYQSHAPCLNLGQLFLDQLFIQCVGDRGVACPLDHGSQVASLGTDPESSEGSHRRW